MATKNYTINDRRGGKNPEPQEACRVCGSKDVHTQKYNNPTMECIEYLRCKSSINLENSIRTNICSSAILTDAIHRIENWGPGPTDALWIKDVANPFLQSLDKLIKDNDRERKSTVS